MASITGILTQDGTPLAGGQVTAFTDTVLATAVTDASGNYRLDDLPADEQIHVLLVEDYGEDWAANTVTSLGDRVHSGDYVFDCTTAGTTGSSEPSWDTGGTTADNDVVWTAKAYYKPYIYGPVEAGDIPIVVNFNMTETLAPPPATAVDFDMTEGPYAPPEEE